MKRFFLIAMLLFRLQSFAQQDEIAQLLLNVEKLAQFKQILQDMKDGYDILSAGYNTIRDLSKGNFNLHKLFLDGLLEVSPAVRSYYRIARVVDLQRQVINASRRGIDGFRESDVFTPDELLHFKRIADRVVSQSIENIASLTAVITAGKLRMSDAERLAAIDRLFDEVSEQLRFIMHFNNSTGILALQRLKEKKDIDEVKVLHDVK